MMSRAGVLNQRICTLAWPGRGMWLQHQAGNTAPSDQHT